MDELVTKKNEKDESISPELEKLPIVQNNFSQKKVFLYTILGIAIFLICLIGFKVQQIMHAIAQGKSFIMPPEAVTTSFVIDKFMNEKLKVVGFIASLQGVMLSADLPGIVTDILVQSGLKVEKGTLLVTLDTRQEEAELRMNQAKQGLAYENLSRAQELFSKKVIARSILDDAQCQYNAATASIDSIKATIDRKRIHAPFSGILGIRKVNIGEYLKSGDPILALESSDPIYVNFSVPQQVIPLLQLGDEISVQLDGTDKLFNGKISAINALVETATRNIDVQGTLPNPNGILKSGMFVNITVIFPIKKHHVLIPATSVQYTPYGNFVFVVQSMKKKNKIYQGVHEKSVILGKNYGDEIEIISGLSVGDEVVTSGLFKLHEGTAIQINNHVQPSHELSPKLIDN